MSTLKLLEHEFPIHVATCDSLPLRKNSETFSESYVNSHETQRGEGSKGQKGTTKSLPMLCRRGIDSKVMQTHNPHKLQTQTRTA